MSDRGYDGHNQQGGDWGPGVHAGAAARATAADAQIDARLGFIRRTYAHLAGAIALFVVLTTVLVNSPVAELMVNLMTASSMSWLVVLALFIGSGWVADWWAHNMESTPLQYLGLALGVVSYSIVFIPMLFIAAHYSSPEVIPNAAITTLAVFSVLTGFVFVTKRDFSMLRTGLVVFSALAFGAIIAGMLFGFTLGLGFSIIMVGLAAGYVVYYTSNVLHHYRTDQHVAAALALFSAIALMFWYILRIFMSRN
ncbi:MAG: Bax inhibitor-1 family protein [Bradymonadaceae bacterium]|nr:Bax inhibitor-1 family protein [Lujinxingiaceae bacterium]